MSDFKYRVTSFFTAFGLTATGLSIAVALVWRWENNALRKALTLAGPR